MTYKMARLKPEVHRKIKTEASKLGLSFNNFLDKVVKEDSLTIEKNEKQTIKKPKISFKW